MDRQLKRPAAEALIAITALGFALRVIALTGAGGPSGAATGYDDGVYFSASALLLRGVLPYRDFVFVHPPGILHFLSLVSWLPDPATGFVAARVLAAIVALNTRGGQTVTIHSLQYPHASVETRDLPDRCGSSIGRIVVDDDHLLRDAGENGVEAAQQFDGILALVERRKDDREIEAAHTR